jgi:hypothetical protein
MILELSLLRRTVIRLFHNHGLIISQEMISSSCVIFTRLLSIECRYWRNGFGKNRLRGFVRHEGFDVTFIGDGGFVGGLVRCPANTKNCTTRKMMRDDVNAS